MSAGHAFLMSRSDVSAGHAFLTSRLDVSAEISHHCDRMCSCLDGSLPSVWLDVFPWMVVPF